MEAQGFMQQLPEGMYTRGQVATKIGKSRDTIRRWHENGTYRSTHQQKFGAVSVWLYTDEDVQAMKQIARRITPGRKPKEEE